MVPFMIENTTWLEKQAIKAVHLSAFPVNFADIRRSIKDLLGEIGRYGFFNEYTVHNFSHVEEMLKIAEWIIPEETKNKLTLAECFLLTMGIYFHDLGMLITRKEFENRDKKIIETWAENSLFQGSDGQDYRSRVSELKTDERDRLLYQEYVRAHHGARVRMWLEGGIAGNLQSDNAVVSEIEKLISPLSSVVRRDLAIICESHNLDDIDDSEKYPLSQPYGNSFEEEVDLQYLAIVLRTADLLQITKHRAPSTLFRIISPSDPVSQIEWHKQNAVRRIRKKDAIDQEGVTNASIPSDTIEVFAQFKEAEGFFGLTSYLRYAESQLERSFQAIEKSRKLRGGNKQFPWRKINDEKVEAEGFIPRTFGFELDQSRILTLLTGHTLYNDSTVVIREIIQNSIDAVRLQGQNKGPKFEGKIVVHWDTSKSELVITDNGTGMTQDIIERHLLKVGSSRYQDPQFRKQYPDFSPISRFGIGVLTAFMVADSVEIITVSPEEDKARQISLRTVHGKYLIRLVDKTAPTLSRLGAHGTSFTLRLRPSAKAVDVLATVQRWIMFPGCLIEVVIDKEKPVQVGYNKPGDALTSYLQTEKGKRFVGNRKYKILEKELAGLSIACVVSRNEFFKDWALVGGAELSRLRQDFEEFPIGTCIEGVAVDFNSPGFQGQSILAIANATGVEAPRTNVARSALEDTPERNIMIEKIYRVFSEQVADEVKRLSVEEKYSLTWAVGQVPFLAEPYVNPRARQADRFAFEDSVAQLPLFLIESENGRIAASLQDLVERDEIWHTEAPWVQSVEGLVREAKSDVTARSIIELTHGKGWLPRGDIISNAASSTLSLETLQRKFEIKELRAREADRWLDIKLGLKDDNALWLGDDHIRLKLRRADARTASIAGELTRMRGHNRSSNSLWVPMGDVPTDGLDGFGMVDVLKGTYVLPGQKIAKCIADFYIKNELRDLMQAAIYFEVINILRARNSKSSEDNMNNLEDYLQQLYSIFKEWIDIDALKQAVRESQFRSFSPLAWRRREGETFDVNF